MSFELFVSFLGASTLLFACLKWVGAGYLIYLGVRTWRTQPLGFTDHTQVIKRSNIFRDAVIVTALNPKSIVFLMMAFSSKG